MLINKQELCNILNIKTRTLKQIEADNKLYERLENKGYKLINRTKEGRSIIYEIELINENKEVYSNLCKYVFNTNKDFEFAKYFINRIIINDFTDPTIDKLTPNFDIIGVTSKTVRNWDNTLVNNNIILKDGFYYICIDNEHKQIYMCSKEEYNTYYKNKSSLNFYKKLEDKLKSGDYNFMEVMNLHKLWLTQNEGLEEAINSKYYYKIKKYINNKNNELYIDTLNLINNLYFNIKTIE